MLGGLHLLVASFFFVFRRSRLPEGGIPNVVIPGMVSKRQICFGRLQYTCVSTLGQGLGSGSGLGLVLRVSVRVRVRAKVRMRVRVRARG